LELCGDDLLCRSCEVQNAAALSKVEYAKLQDQLQQLWAAHKQLTNEVMELKCATFKQPSESTDIADPLSTKLSDKIRPLQQTQI